MRSTRNITFLIFAIITTSSTLHAQVQRDDLQIRKEESDEHRNDLTEFRFKFRALFASLPRVTLRETSFQLAKEALKTAEEGRVAFTKNNLEEAEAKLLASLSLREDDLVRKDYALTLVEEKKYLEALPNCVEAALIDHNRAAESYSLPVEESPLPLPTLAFGLAQVGGLKQGVVVYNFTRMKLEKDIKRNIEMFRSNKKSDTMTISEKLRLPLPPLELDTEKTDRKTLIETSSILFFIISELYFDEIAQEFQTKNEILPNRFAARIMEDAYKANPDSAILNFYKGYLELSKRVSLLDDIVVSIKKEQPWYLSAIKIAGAGSKIGAISKEYYDASEQRRILMEKLIKERNDKP